MNSSYSLLSEDGLRDLLARQQKNLEIAELQIAFVGGDGNADLKQLNQRDVTRATLLSIRIELERRGLDAETPRPAEVTRIAYLEALVNELQEHTIRGFAPQVGGRVLSLPLAKIFLPLQAQEGRPALSRYAEEDVLFQTIHENTNELDWMRRQIELEKRHTQLNAQQASQRSLTLTTLLRQPRAVLLGHPGSGKTTLTRYICYALAAGDGTYIGQDVQGRVPILLRVANYARAFEKSPLHIIDYIERELTTKPEFGTYLREAIKAGQCLIILDGLDEVTKTELRQEVTNRIRSLVSSYGANHYLVSSRIIGYDQSPLTREFTHATLRDLGPSDRERFVRLWYTAIESEIAEEQQQDDSNELVEALHNRPQIARMAASPLLLTIMVLMHWRGTRLPSRRVQVYQNATDTLAEYWARQRGVELDAEEIKQILAPVAYRILESSVGGVISRYDLEPLVQRTVAEQHGCSGNDARRISRELLRDLNEQSGLFLERGEDGRGQPVYGFLHQTFGEYLTALYLANLAQEGRFELGLYLHQSRWREPLLLMIAHLALYNQALANMLVYQILNHPGIYEDTLQRNALFVADCLADDIQLRPVLRAEVLYRLANLLHHPAPQVQEQVVKRYEQIALTKHREAAGAILKEVYALQNTSTLPDYEDETRLHIATALVRVGEQTAAQPIVWDLDAKAESELSSELERKVYTLRFEGWPEEAASYLLHLQRKQYFSLVAENDRINSMLGPISLDLARTVLHDAALLRVIATLQEGGSFSEDSSKLQWLAAIIPERTEPELLSAFLSPENPPDIRRMAATRLLDTSYKASAVETLHDITVTAPKEAAAAARELLRIGETAQVNWRILADTALMPNDEDAPQAIVTLLQAGIIEVALPAALHALAVFQPEGTRRDLSLWLIVEGLITYNYTHVGLAAARWLALRIGYEKRLLACEALLESGLIQEAIPLLYYLAYEITGEQQQQVLRPTSASQGGRRRVATSCSISTRSISKATVRCLYRLSATSTNNSNSCCRR